MTFSQSFNNNIKFHRLRSGDTRGEGDEKLTDKFFQIQISDENELLYWISITKFFFFFLFSIFHRLPSRLPNIIQLFICFIPIQVESKYML